MTTIAKKKPADYRVPVYVTEDVYEVWYCQPRSLGTIERRGNYWYTEDNMRFPASRDAMNYLVRLDVLISQLPKQPGQSKVETISVEARRELAEKLVSKPVAPKVAVKPVKAGASSTVTQTATVVAKPELTNQSHPMFQQFIEFMDFVGRRKARGLLDPNSPRVDSAS